MKLKHPLFRGSEWGAYFNSWHIFFHLEYKSTWPKDVKCAKKIPKAAPLNSNRSHLESKIYRHYYESLILYIGLQLFEQWGAQILPGYAPFFWFLQKIKKLNNVNLFSDGVLFFLWFFLGSFHVKPSNFPADQIQIYTKHHRNV